MARAVRALSDRFLLGSDTWINERWQSYGDIMAGYRAWLAQLPAKDRGADCAWQCAGAVRRGAVRPGTRQGSAYSRQL